MEPALVIMPPMPAKRTLVDRDSPLLQEAMRLWRAASHERALAAYDAAIRAEPTNARILVNAARCFAMRHRLDRTRSILRTLERLGPNEPRIHQLIGETYRLVWLPDDALAAFERSLALQPDPRVMLEVAAILEQKGRLDDAGRFLADALDRAPDDPWGLLIRARIERRTGRDDDARATLQSLIDAEGDSDLACQAWADLAQARDRAGDAPGAMQAIHQCKRMQRSREGRAWHAAEHVAARFERMIDDLTPKRIDTWPGTDGAPEIALLAGFPRSGTTLLEQIIDAHSGVDSVEERDVLSGDIFASLTEGHPDDAPVIDLLDKLAAPIIRRARQRYVKRLRQWMPNAAPGRLLLDKNPGSTLMIPVLRRLVPGAPVIVALRDPRDVVLSCYLRHLPVNPLSAHFLTIERTARKYAMDMRGWLAIRACFPEHWIEVRYEDLVDDLEGTARRVMNVLGLAWEPDVLRYRERSASKTVLSPTYADVWRPVDRRAVGRWQRYEAELAPVMPILKPYIETFGYA